MSFLISFSFHLSHFIYVDQEEERGGGWYVYIPTVTVVTAPCCPSPWVLTATTSPPPIILLLLLLNSSGITTKLVTVLYPVISPLAPALEYGTVSTSVIVRPETDEPPLPPPPVTVSLAPEEEIPGRVR